MWKIFIVIWFLVSMTVRNTVYGQECQNQKCDCCVVPNTRCWYYKNTRDYCLDGCKDGIWGNRCYNTCPVNCIKCTQGSNDGGRPCTSCISGKYGDNCDQSCAAGCDGGICFIDGSCTCKAGYSGNNCDINDCPDNCLTCTSSTFCQTCVDGYYNGYKSGSTDYTNVCKHPCSTRPHCKYCTGYDSCYQCNDGYHGQNCEHQCSFGCQTQACNKFDGKCDQCIAGKYGDACNLDCKSQDCRQQKCLKESGWCQSCSDGTFGNNTCDQSCSQHCKINNACDFVTGKCTYNCEDGYSGDKCCVNNNNCVTCSSNTQCSVCKTGYSGDKCCVNNYHCDTCSSSDQCSVCKSGYSGDKCCVNNDKCITCSSPSACSECEPGFSGDKCCLANNYCENCSSNTTCSKCKDGRYGSMCTELCPDNCADTFCKHDGSCYSCKQGFFGNNCETECLENCKECNSNGGCTTCIDGYYGTSCDNRCPANCVSCSSDSYCDNCQPGYYRDTCQTECSNCKVGTKCNKYNGNCEEACKDGMNGQSCNSKCNNGCVACDRTYASRCTMCSHARYGKNSWETFYHCNSYCSSHCYQKACNGSNGYCDTCIEGFKGDLCDCPVNCQCTETGKCDTCVDNFANINKNCTDCALNLFGVDCKSECDNNCLDNDQNTKCHGTNGSCIIGCSDGFYGNRCHLSCDQNCVNGTCSRIDGICSYGCKDGFTDSGAICVIAEASVGDDAEGSGAVIGGSVGGVIVVLAVVGVLMFVFLKRRRGNNNKYASQYANDDTQNNLKNMSGSAHIYDNTTETVNLYPPETEENVNNVIKPVSNPNYNKPPVKPKPKVEDIRKSVKTDDSRNSVKPENLRKSVKPEEPPEIDFDNVANAVLPTTTATDGNYGYYNVAGMKRGLPVAKLAEHVAKRDKDDFEQEFKEFGNGLVRPYLDSQKPQNRARNRYQQIYPYDEHRVHLQGSSTDYINASHIDGYQHPKEYIACLGPTEKASEKFVIVWMMIWEQKVETIAMVTNLFENGTMKCEQYWPDVTTRLKYGDVTVTCHSEDEYADYTLRSFTVSKDSENRSLHHIHYTAWPDKGVPDNVTSIIEFRQRVNSMTTKLGGPVIVHCSAGVGRTGTYIALDSLTKEGKDTKSVNIHGFVQKMREQRVNMVQTAEQYQYLHSAVVHSLTFDCAAITAEQFKRHFNNMDDKTMAAKFKQLQSTVEKKSDEEVKAIALNKKHKDLNRSGADIPGDYRRPKLHINKDTESCDYINAVLVNSFKTKNRFIVAMTPLSGTVLAFLTLLYQENCSCIVSLEAPESLNDKNVGTYYPADNQELKHGVFKVTCTKGVTSDSYVMRKLTITYNKQTESTSKTFTHFQFTKWSRGGHVPSDPATFLQMILDVETKANATVDNGPILIHCLTGSARSGLYCAVSILREKMEIEHEVSVVNTVRYIKSRRPSAIPNKDQYAFCHQAVVAYLDTFDKDIYSNFSLKL